MCHGTVCTKGCLKKNGLTITAISPGSSGHGLSSLFSYHKPVDVPLFVKPPDLTCINQQQLGDCWFLASIAAILLRADGPCRLAQMMREGKDHVYVRLYDSQRVGHIVKMEKTAVFSMTGDEWHVKLDATLGSWPVFLEKALTAFNRERAFDPQSATYARTAGGYGTDGLSLLLGLDTIKRKTEMQDLRAENPVSMERIQEIALLLGGHLDPLRPQDTLVLQQALGINPLDWATFNQWTQGQSLDTKFSSQVLGTQTPKTRDLTLPRSLTNPFGTQTLQVQVPTILRFEHLEAWFRRETIGLAQNLIDSILRWIKASGLAPGKRGSGLYSDQQLETFNYMLGLSHQQIPMTAGTGTYVGMQQQGSTMHKEKVKGLVPNHEYAVVQLVDTPQGQVKQVGLFNPWGEVGRAEDLTVPHLPNRSTPVCETNSGLFFLDLDDFCKRFQYVAHPTERLPPLDA